MSHWVVIKPGMEQNRRGWGTRQFLYVLFLQFEVAKHFDCCTMSFIVSTIIYYLAVVNKVSDTVMCHVIFLIKAHCTTM